MTVTDNPTNQPTEQARWSLWQHQSWKVWLALVGFAIAVWIAYIFFPHRSVGAAPFFAGWIAQVKKSPKGTTTFKFEWQWSDWIGAAIVLLVCVAIFSGVPPAAILHWLKDLL